MPKNVLITDATSKLSQHFINQLIQMDCNLFLVSNNSNELIKIQKEVEKKNENKFEIFKYDLTKNENAVAFYKELNSKNVKIDILIVIPEMEEKSSFSELALENYFVSQDLLFSSLVTLIHFIAFDMLERKSGKILILGSLITYLPFSHYSCESICNAYDLDNKAKNLYQKMDDSSITFFNFFDNNSTEKQILNDRISINDNYKGKILGTIEILKLSFKSINN